MSPGTEDPRKKIGRSIRRPARIRPLENSPIAFRAQWTSGRAPALHASRLSRERLSLSLIPSVAPIARRMRPLSIGRVESAFHPAIVLPTIDSALCKEDVSKKFSQKAAPALIARRSGLPLPVPIACDNSEHQDLLIRTKGSLPDLDGHEAPALIGRISAT